MQKKTQEKTQETLICPDCKNEVIIKTNYDKLFGIEIIKNCTCKYKCSYCKMPMELCLCSKTHYLDGRKTKKKINPDLISNSNHKKFNIYLKFE